MSTSPIIITPSTSVVLVNTADYSGNPVVLLPNLAGPGALGRIITVRDNDGGSVDPAKSIYLSTTGGARFQPELSSITLSTIRISQPYGFITLTPRLTDPSGNTNYGLMNVYAFPEASPAAYINTFNANFSYLSTLSTANLAVSQDTIIQGNLTVGGGITYVNPGNTTLDIGTVNTNLISAATILNSNFYGVNAAVSTINTSSFVVREAGSILLPNAGSWSNAASFAGATDPNSLTIGNPAASAGAQIGLSSFFFGIRSFTSNADGDKFSTTIVMRDGTVGINLSEINNIGTLNNTLNYSLYVRGATQMSNLGVNNNILLLKTADTNGSNVEVNRFGTGSSNYRIDSSSNITEGFYDSINQFHWLTVDKNGSVKFWSGTGSRSSNLERVTIDNAGRMGVGTTTPGRTLDVSGELRVTGTSRLGADRAPTIIGTDANAYMILGRGRDVSGGSYIDFDISSTPGIGSRIIRESSPTSQNFNIINYGTGNLQFGTNGIDNRMVMDSAGRVGIGKIPSILYNLDISGDTRITNQGTGANAKLDFTSDSGGTLSIRRTVGENNNADIINTGTGLLGFGTNNTSGRMIIDASGRVGINTTSPNYNLDVSGTIMARESIYVGGDAGKDGAQIFMSGGPGDANYENTVIESRLYSGTEDTELLLFKGNDPDSGPGPDRIRLRAGQICFDTYPSATSSRTDENIRMVIDKDGNVGVNTTNPLAPMMISKDSLNNINTTGGQTWGENNNPSQLLLTGATNTNERLAIGYNTISDVAAIQSLDFGAGVKNLLINPNGGNVGIGTTGTPDYTLDVNGKIRIQNSVTNRLIFSDQNNINKISLYGADSMTEFMGFGVDPNMLTYNVPTNNDHVFYYAGATERMRIQGNTGRIGIGTANPGAQLDLRGSSGNSNLYIRQVGESSQSGIYFGTQNSDSSALKAAIIAEGINSSSRSKLHFCLDNTLDNSTTYNAALTNSRMTITNDGNVGIGCNAPSVKLDVNGSTKITGDLNVTGTITGTLSVVPTGCIMMWSAITPSVPTGWLLCDGTSYSTSSYPALFTAINYTYGGSEGSFNVPNMKGRVPVGRDAAQTEFDTLGETGGAKTHTLTVDEMPKHSHNVRYYDSGSGADVPSWDNDDSSTRDVSTGDAGNDQPHNNLQPYIVLNYIIKT